MKNFKNYICQFKWFLWKLTHRKKALDLINKKFPMLMAEKLASVQPMKEDLSIVAKMKVSDFKWKEGDYGHNFVGGYFIVNENGEEIYRSKNPEEYDRLFFKYKINEKGES